LYRALVAPADRSPIQPEQVKVVPANEATWDDLVAVFGTRDYAARCLCQRLKMWRETTLEQRAAMLAADTGCDDPAATSTSGLVAYVDGEPAGWAAVEPRIAYPKLAKLQLPWKDRDEDKSADDIWAVTCLIVRKGYRGRGLTYLLAEAAVGYAREQGARAIEGYPMITEPGKEVTWGELYVGARQVFEDTGFEQVSHPTKRRVVMRIDFQVDPG
jgi:GNAT superfamily N-acetyltransferase